YNSFEFVHPDPVEFLHLYPDPRDREIVGLVASGLAYGRVRQILRSVESALRPLVPPRDFLDSVSDDELRSLYAGFKHRFTTGGELTALLIGIRRCLAEFGSLESCFLSGLGEGDESIIPASRAFIRHLAAGRDGRNSLLPMVDSPSACKRLFLYIKWMSRHDATDPGGWSGVPSEKLIIPLDTHMFRIGRLFGFTSRSSADLAAAVEVTRGFARFEPHDPTKYDFCLTRLGIRELADVVAALTRLCSCNGTCLRLDEQVRR
ncbi:MAG: TIGR02757 family protein, partial [Candidatus Brocadiia bacterium]